MNKESEKTCILGYNEKSTTLKKVYKNSRESMLPLSSEKHLIIISSHSKKHTAQYIGNTLPLY